MHAGIIEPDVLKDEALSDRDKLVYAALGLYLSDVTPEVLAEATGFPEDVCREAVLILARREYVTLKNNKVYVRSIYGYGVDIEEE